MALKREDKDKEEEKESEALFLLGTSNGDAYSDYNFNHADENNWGEW